MTTAHDTPATLASAEPPPRRGHMFVLYSGLLTTGLTLLGVYFLNTNTEDFNVMGWYANYIIPVGALLVGLAAGSGYGIGSAISGKKISRRLLLAVLALQVVAYFVAQYIEFRQLALVYEDSGQRVGFWEYFHFSATSFAWKNKSGGYGSPMGMWGYAFRLLEVAGFALGGMVVPGVMMTRPYCDTCQRYKKRRELAVIPAGVRVRKVAKADTAALAAYDAEQQQAMDEGLRQFEQLRDLAAAGDAPGFRAALAPLEPGTKAAGKLPRRVQVAMVECRGCYAGTLEGAVLTGTGDKVHTDVLPPTDLAPEFVFQLGKA